MVDIKIVASRERQEMVEKLQSALGLTEADIVYDEREEPGNPYVLVKQAWLLPHAEGVTHRVVLNDDVQVCTGFEQIIEQMAQSHPDCALSLFTMAFDSESYNDFIHGIESPYVDHSWGLWGCAIMMPVAIVEDCFNYIDTVFREDVPFCCQSVSSKNASTISIPCLETMLWKASGFSAFSDTNRFQYYPRFR